MPTAPPLFHSKEVCSNTRKARVCDDPMATIEVFEGLLSNVERMAKGNESQCAPSREETGY